VDKKTVDIKTVALLFLKSRRNAPLCLPIKTSFYARIKGTGFDLRLVYLAKGYKTMKRKTDLPDAVCIWRSASRLVLLAPEFDKGYPLLYGR
jgi:hypothetical protein